MTTRGVRALNRLAADIIGNLNSTVTLLRGPMRCSPIVFPDLLLLQDYLADRGFGMDECEIVSGEWCREDGLTWYAYRNAAGRVSLTNHRTTATAALMRLCA